MDSKPHIHTHLYVPLGLFACQLIFRPNFYAQQTNRLAEESARAKQAMDAGRYAEAVALYRELVREVPGNSGLMMDLGLALHSAGRYREAIEEFHAVLRRQPSFASAWFLLGVAHLKMGQAEKAIEPLEHATTLDPANPAARFELADAFLSLGRADEAIRRFEDLTSRYPDMPKAWQGLGLSYVSLSQRNFLELEQIAPESGYWYALLARSRTEQSQYRSAFYFYRQALSKSPALRGIHLALAEIYRTTGHPDWATVEEERERLMPPPECVSESFECDFLAGRFRRALELSKSSKTPEGHYWQARGAEELALEAFARLEKLPPSAEVHELMAAAYRIRGLHVQSVKEWQEALQLAPGDHRLEKELARSLWLAQRYQDAERLLARLLTQEPESAELNHEQGDTLLRLGETEKAVPYLEKAVQYSTSLLPAHASLARAYLRLGRIREALPHLNLALRIDEDGGLYYQLAQAYQKSGQEVLAQQAMRKFEEISKTAMARKRKFEDAFEISPP